MVIKCVCLESDAYMVCLTHALSTEREEVMGLLIGEIDENRISHISAVIMLQRSDKQADRVEISPEQLSDASTKAERMAKELCRPMRVLGWYHSHPHITVWPSHVDVQTQAMYQMMDEGFVGLIFSVFNEDKSTKLNRIEVTCFQSINQAMEDYPSQYARKEVPFYIEPSKGIGKACMDSLVQLPRILCQEEKEAFSKTTDGTDLDLITKLHNVSVYTKSLCHITEVMSGPLIQALENRLETNRSRIQTLQARKLDIEKQLKEIDNS